MSKSQNGITRRIPNNLGGTDNLFDRAPIVGAVQFTDGILAFSPALFLLFIFENILPQQFAFIGFTIAGVAAFFGVLALVAKPSYLTLSDWVSDIRRFRKQPDVYRKALPNGEGGDDSDSSVESIAVNSDQDTRSKINIERLYPKYGAIERPDDTVVGIVRIRGLNLDAASQQQLAQKVYQFDDFLNRQLQEDVQFYMPMQQFDPTHQVEMYEERIEDSRIFQNDPLLQEYISDRISFISAMSMGAYIRRYYLICEVPKYEVVSDEVQAGETKRALEEVSEILGQLYVAIKGANATMITDKELKTKQLETLEERMLELSNQIESKLGCKTNALNADEAGVLLKEFWEGVHVNEEEEEGFIRKNPYVKGELDKERVQDIEEENAKEDDNELYT